MGDIAVTVLRRALTGLVTVFVLMTIVFFLVRTLGDPVEILAGPDALPEQIEAIRLRLGLDVPLYQQYVDYVASLLGGDAGESWRTGQPAAAMVVTRMPATLQLGAIAIGLAALIAIPVGVISALKPGSVIDSLSRVVAVLGQSMPVFWLGILLILVFAVGLGWFPAGGRDGWASLVLPGVTLSVYSIPLTMRLTRSAMLEVLNRDYITTARSKGLPERRVIMRHALRNAMIPVITVLALRVGHVLGGVLVLESVFAYPGVGRLAAESILTRDFPVIQFFVMFIALVVIFANLLADLLYTVVDPRIRVG